MSAHPIRRLRLALALGCAAVLASGAGAAPPDRATTELHAHLFMKQGMSWMFDGDFFGPLRATDWTARFKSQADPASLNRSELGVVVATLYAHPLLTWSMRDSIRRQIADARRFVAENPRWIIATSAGQARRALDDGKQAMILALEGASGIIETDDDIAEFVDRGGIRIVTFLHLMDDSLGGVAFLAGIRALADPIAWLAQLFKPRFESGVRVNDRGLTDQGRALAIKLIDRGVWLDLAHASDASTRELIRLTDARHQPLLYAHTTLRKYHGAERGLADWELAEVKRTGGAIGLMPSEDYLAGTPGECGFRQFITQYREVASALGADAISIGSDWNGGLPHLMPDCATPPELKAGMKNVGEIPSFWAALERAGAPVPKPLSRMTDRFIATWARVKP